MLMSADERTFWRDSALSQRHREYGCDCPAVDIDFLMIEYDHAKPCGLVEYKNEHAAPIYLKRNPSIQALLLLANRANLPAFIVRYADDFSWWKVGALNELAAKYLNSNPEYMNEIEWVEKLYEIRGRSVPEDVRERIENLTQPGF